MSLGYSITELIQAGKFALDLYRACESAPDVFQEAAQQCLSVYVAIGQTQRCLPKTTAETNSASHETANRLSAITSGCRASLKKLEDVVGKYKSLGSAAPKIWDSFRFGAKGIQDDLADIRSELGLHLTTLGVFVASLQKETLGEIKQSLARLEKRDYDTFAGGSNIQHESNPPFSMGTVISRVAHHQHSSVTAPAPAPAPEERREQDESIRNAIEDKRILLETKLSTYEDLRASVMLCSAAEQESVKISERSFRYSGDEEWLSRLPEGWQRTMVSQNEYQYRYLLGTKQIRSRVYDLKCPFEPILEVQSNTLPEGWTESTGSGRRKYFSHLAKGLAQLERPLTKVKNTSEQHYVGYDSIMITNVDSY
jgi:hypothetical protein